MGCILCLDDQMKINSDPVRASGTICEKDNVLYSFFLCIDSLGNVSYFPSCVVEIFFVVFAICKWFGNFHHILELFSVFHSAWVFAYYGG